MKWPNFLERNVNKTFAGVEKKNDREADEAPKNCHTTRKHPNGAQAMIRQIHGALSTWHRLIISHPLEHMALLLTILHQKILA